MPAARPTRSSSVVYSLTMDDLKFEERLNRIEKITTEGFARMEEGFTYLQGLIDSLANISAREFKNITERFVAVDTRFEILEGKIDGISRRMDIAVEDRKKLEDRVSKIEEIAAH